MVLQIFPLDGNITTKMSAPHNCKLATFDVILYRLKTTEYESRPGHMQEQAETGYNYTASLITGPCVDAELENHSKKDKIKTPFNTF